MKLILATLALLASSTFAEDITLVVTGNGTDEFYSDPVTLGQGDTATLLSASRGPWPTLQFTVGAKTIECPCFRTEADVTRMQPVVIAGPATLRVRVGGYNSNGHGFATLGIKRAGTASEPTAIPQEAGAAFDVILESSSDLVNWLPVNPGEYTGTEARRFFRTRIVKKEQP